MGFFALALVFLSMQGFYFIDIKPNSIDFKNIQAHDITLYELNSSAVANNYEAQIWTRYKQKDILEHFTLLNADFNLSSNEVEVLNNDFITLKGNVVYEDKNQTRILSPLISFDSEKKELSTQKDFIIYRKKSEIKGQSLNYDLNSKELEVKGARAWLVLD